MTRAEFEDMVSRGDIEEIIDFMDASSYYYAERYRIETKQYYVEYLIDTIEGMQLTDRDSIFALNDFIDSVYDPDESEYFYADRWDEYHPLDSFALDDITDDLRDYLNENDMFDDEESEAVNDDEGEPEEDNESMISHSYSELAQSKDEAKQSILGQLEALF